MTTDISKTEETNTELETKGDKPTCPPFVLNQQTLAEGFKKFKPALDFDPDVFPKKFAFEVKLVIHQMKLAYQEIYDEYVKKLNKWESENGKSEDGK